MSITIMQSLQYISCSHWKNSKEDTATTDARNNWLFYVCVHDLDASNAMEVVIIRFYACLFHVDRMSYRSRVSFLYF